MKILVCVKQAAGVPGHFEFLADGTDIDPAFIEHRINDPDLYAVEAALEIRDSNGAGEAIAVTVGDDAAIEAVRASIAMGADRGLRVRAPDLGRFDPVGVASALATAVRVEQPALIITGVQSTDEAQQATGPALAAVLGWPCVVGVTAIFVQNDAIRVHRELEGGHTEVVEVDLPCVISVQTGLNVPRYGSFKDKLKAKNAEVKDVETVSLQSPFRVKRMFAPTKSNRELVLVDGGPSMVAAQIVKLVGEIR